MKKRVFSLFLSLCMVLTLMPTVVFATGTSIENAEVVLGEALTYNKNEQTQIITSVTLDGTTLVAGTDYDVTNHTQTNAGEYNLTITGKGNYSGMKTVPFTIAPKSMNDPSITIDIGEDEVYYNGGALVRPETITVRDGDTVLVEDTDYKLHCSGIGPGVYGNVDVRGLGNYCETNWNTKYTVLPLPLEIHEVIAKDRQYSADSQYDYNLYVDIEQVVFHRAGTDTVVELKKTMEYSAGGWMETADAGNGKIVTVNVNVDSNYKLDNDSVTTTVNISKADPLTDLADVAASVKYNADIEQKISVADAMPADAKVQGYTVGTETDVDNLIQSGWSVDADGVVTFSLESLDESAIGKSATLPVVISSANYEDSTVNVVITLAEKSVPVVAVEDIAVTYSGTPVSNTNIKGTATFGGQAIEGTWAFKEGQDITDVAHSGTKTVVFTPADQDTYMAVETSIQVWIARKELVGEPTFISINRPGVKLSTVTLTKPASWPNGYFEWIGTTANIIPESTVVEQGAYYSWTFVPASDNYQCAYGKIMPYASNNPPSGGSDIGNAGGSGSSSNDSYQGSNNNTSVEKNPDGSTTTTTTDKSTGTVTETTKNTDGSTTTVATQKDGTVTTTDKAVDGSTVQTVEDKNGNVTAEANVSDKAGAALVEEAVSNAAAEVVIAPEISVDATKTEVSVPVSTVKALAEQTDATVMVATPVATVAIPNNALAALAELGGSVTVAAERKDNQIAVEISSGDQTIPSVEGGLTVAVPYENTTPGTVAVLVHEDGTKEIIRKSVAVDGTVSIPLDGSATLELMDNSKDFGDVKPTDWHANAVDFVSAHGLFNGTSETTFSPDNTMTRGMLAMVLHNLESNPDYTVGGTFGDVAEGAWYSGAIQWAAEQGIVGGYGDGNFGAEDHISREQLAVMLWNYAGKPESNHALTHFNDTEQISGYAQAALAWANENGIISGMGDGVLNPKGEATRAQVATMLQKLCENGLN